MLTAENFAKATKFIKENARLLDLRKFEYEFEGGTAVSVLDALSSYQNVDGGFGHAIEPDFRLLNSSPMATSVGFQYCLAVDAPAGHPVVEKAIGYLVETYDREHGYWPFFTDTAVNDYPHAPWWHRDEIVPPSEENWPNVSAELVGYIHQYRQWVPTEFYDQLMTRAKENLESTEILGSFFDCLCWERTAKLVPEPMRAQIATKVHKSYVAMQLGDIDGFQEAPIFAVAHHPEAGFSSVYPQKTAVLLQKSIEQQQEDGGWWPMWQWGQYEDVWPIAQREWAGILTLEALHAYKQFDLLAKEL